MGKIYHGLKHSFSNEVKMNESIETGDSDLTPLIEGDNNFRYDEGYDNAGFTQTSVEDIDTDVFDIYDENSEDRSEDDEDDDGVNMLGDDFVSDDEEE